MQWEYKILQVGGKSPISIEEDANVLGREGWELFAIDDDRERWVFKRPSPEWIEAERKSAIVRLGAIPPAGPLPEHGVEPN